MLGNSVAGKCAVVERPFGFGYNTGEVEIDFASADGVGEAQGDVDSVGFEFHSLGEFDIVTGKQIGRAHV